MSADKHPSALSDNRRLCRCAEGPEAWRKCPLPQHDHTTWTSHGWNCPASCEHPDALAAHAEPDQPWGH